MGVSANFPLCQDMIQQLKTQFSLIHDTQNKQFICHLDRYQALHTFLSQKYESSASQVKVVPIPDFVFALIQNQPP